MKRSILLLVVLSITVVLAACAGNNGDNSADNQNNTDEEENMDNGADNESKNTDEVQVDLSNGDSESVGTATLKENSDGVKVTLEGKNLPKGTHAFHIHEKGQCETPDFKSAKGHFNPADSNHGFDDSGGPHAGDMPNITVYEDGTVTQSFLNQSVTLKEGEDHSLMKEGGTSLVIHKGADDGESQPSGDAGDRLACGTISE